MCVCVFGHSPTWLPLYKARFHFIEPFRAQQTSAVCSLVLEELDSGFLYPEELLLKSRPRGPYLDAESV